VKYFFLRIFKNPLTWIIFVFFSFEAGAYFLFTNIDADGNIIAGTMTGLVIIFGYFITHYLEINRKQREKKFEQYLKLIKGLRLFIVETYLKGDRKKQKELVDNYQNAYFESSVSISKRSYDKLHDAMIAFKKFTKNQNDNNRKMFMKTQSDFINVVRSEFFIEQDIDFETFNVMISENSE